MTPICPIEDAVRFMLSEHEGRRAESWTPAEYAELRRACRRKDAPDFAADVHRAMVCHRNRWSYRAGAADINQLESWLEAFSG